MLFMLFIRSHSTHQIPLESSKTFVLLIAGSSFGCAEDTLSLQVTATIIVRPNTEETVAGPDDVKRRMTPPQGCILNILGHYMLTAFLFCLASFSATSYLYAAIYFCRCLRISRCHLVNRTAWYVTEACA